MKDSTGQCRTAKGSEGQHRAVHDWTGQSRKTGQCMNGQGSEEQDRAVQYRQGSA